MLVKVETVNHNTAYINPDHIVRIVPSNEGVGWTIEFSNDSELDVPHEVLLLLVEGQKKDDWSKALLMTILATYANK